MLFYASFMKQPWEVQAGPQEALCYSGVVTAHPAQRPVCCRSALESLAGGGLQYHTATCFIQLCFWEVCTE